ncbi:MFS transporter [Nonomuraea sp. NPDC049309]|uniref:MFS transporter n=1 Tax=Nonomuraea sp. NPDC049309 TaxID=3364350 RepID=UPI00371866A1
MSGYALGGPPPTTLGARLSRKTMLLSLMVLFIVGNALSALAPTYVVLMAGRFLSAYAHGAYFGVGSVVAAGLVEPRERAGAIALMFTGLTPANVVGVPLGTWIGQSYGRRATFWVVVAIGVAGLAGVLTLVPRRPRPDGGVLREPATFRSGGVWPALAMTVFGFAPVFAAGLLSRRLASA